MRRNSSLVIVMVGLAVLLAAMTNDVRAKERLSLSSLVGRLLKFKQSEPVEPVEQASEATTAEPPQYQPRREGPSFVPPPQANQINDFTRLPEPRVNGLPYPPFPPTVDQAWLHPPKPGRQRAYSTEEILALTRPAGSRAVAGHKKQVRAPRELTMPGATSSRSSDVVANAPIASTRSTFQRRSAPAVQQVSFVEEAAEGDAVPELESLPLSATTIGNRPAEVSQVPAAEENVEEQHREADLGDERNAASPSGIVQVVSQSPLPTKKPAEPALAPVYQKVRGKIAAISKETGIVRIDLSDKETLPVGTKIRVYHETNDGEAVAIHVQVIDSIAGVAAAKLIDGSEIDDIATGDRTVAWRVDTGQ